MGLRCAATAQYRHLGSTVQSLLQQSTGAKRAEPLGVKLRSIVGLGWGAAAALNLLTSK